MKLLERVPYEVVVVSSMDTPLPLKVNYSNIWPAAYLRLEAPSFKVRAR